MKDFSDLAVELVHTVERYIFENSSIEDLRITVRELYCDKFSDRGTEFTKCTCDIYNELQKGSKLRISMTSYDDNSYMVDIICPDINNFGLTSIMSSFTLNYDGSHKANVDVKYVAKVPSTDLMVETEEAVGRLLSYESDFTSSMSRTGVFSFTDILDYEIILDLYTELLDKSKTCLGK